MTEVAPSAGSRIAFVPMSGEDIAMWLPESMAYYEAARLRAGDSEVEATAARQASMDRFFPDGRHLIDGQFLFSITADGEDVGWLWFGPWAPSGRGAWWIWDIHVRAPHRRRGHGRAAMAFAEQFARDQGASSLMLDVFASNVGAIELYEALGFEVASLHMMKPL